jgi:mono/diheme cytochrome c family protein
MLRQRKTTPAERLRALLMGSVGAAKNQIAWLLALTAGVSLIYGCAMSEEMKRIQERKDAERMRDASLSPDLTGEQLFIRSCNTCHPGGKKGFGPSLEDLGDHIPDDAKLKLLIRQGKGIMPGQPKQTMNDQELDNLVDYLRKLTAKE